jgi:dienelactone hydrolase
MIPAALTGGRFCRRALALAATAVAAGLLWSAVAAAAFDPAYEAKDYSKTLERARIYMTPEYQLRLRRQSIENNNQAILAQARDPERNFVNLCANGFDGCAGDVRLYDWGPKGYGIVKPVLFTARDGATLSGHVWATKAGPARRPGIVITNGSVQADEQMYWYAAQALAKDGYVVMTFDPQGQGQSDIFGEGADRLEGVPAQSDGRPFFDGTEDAIDFFYSDARHPYEPVPSCSTGTSHAPKQARRVAAGFDSAYNPLAGMFDRGRFGLAGHSYGAAGVSYIGQWDSRVDAVVAWDNLQGTDPNAPLIGSNPSEQPCPADPSQRTAAPIAKPALGMSADYFLPPTPNTSQPDPESKTAESVRYSDAGVDSGELIIRGGSHLDFSWIPNPAFGASLRGADMIDWYTSAWFDKYVKGDASADRRLLSDRWFDDAREAAVDPDGDGNMFSRYYRSRLDVGLARGGRFDCEDLRPDPMRPDPPSTYPAGTCPGFIPRAQDGWPGEYDYVAIATSPDRRGP